MASVHKLPHTRYWYASFRAGGKQHLRSTKQTDRTAAMTVAAQYEKAGKLSDAKALTEGQARDVLNDILKLSAPTEELRAPKIASFLRDWVKTKEAAKAASTAARYGTVVEAFIAHLGDRAERPLPSLAPGDVQSFIDKRLKEGGCSATTVNLDGKILRTTLNAARRQGLIGRNPAEAVELPAIHTTERGTFTPAEVKMLVDAADNPEWKTLIMFGYFTGARLTDCCQMAWTGERAAGDLREGIDLANGWVVYWNTKRKKLVQVPLHPELQAYLEQLASTDCPSPYVSPHMAELKTGGRHGLSEGFKRIVRNAGLDLQTVQGGGKRKISRRTFHALRHTFASGLANAAVPPELRMKFTGHSSERVHGGYSHHAIKTLRKAMSKLPGITPSAKKGQPQPRQAQSQ